VKQEKNEGRAGSCGEREFATPKTGGRIARSKEKNTRVIKKLTENLA
jgi:hypothetical protein